MESIGYARPTLKGLQAHRAKAKLLRFVQWMRADYHAGLHHIQICAKLDDFLAGRIKRIMIFVPPQHGKSELSSRYFPAFALGHNPNAKIALASYSDDLASSFNADVQRIIDTDEYRELFPETLLNGFRPHWGGVLQGYQRNSTIFEIVGKRGSFRSVGIGAGLTGRTVDIGIIDDPVKNRVEAESATTREKVWGWYTDTFLTRLHKDSQQLLLMTRWHDDDLAGRLLKQDEKRIQNGEEPYWEVVSFPALKEGEPTQLDPRQPGEALWPERHDKPSLLEKKEQGGERSFDSLYQQKPVKKKGNIIKTERFGRISWPEFAALTQSVFVEWHFKIDGAYTTKTENDATALWASYFHEPTQTLYVRESLSVRMEIGPLCRFIPLFTARNGYNWASRIKIEPKASGYSIIQTIKESTALNVEAYEFPKVEGIRMDDKDKIARAYTVAPKVDAARVVLLPEAAGHPWHQTFMEQAGAFPLAAHDDEVDNLVMDLLECYFGKDRKKVSSGN